VSLVGLHAMVYCDVVEGERLEGVCDGHECQDSARWALVRYTCHGLENWYELLHSWHLCHDINIGNISILIPAKQERIPVSQVWGIITTSIGI
jgi:hypothetical protein